MFCSEAVVVFYQMLGLIDTKLDPEKISPEELSKWKGDAYGKSPFNNEYDYLIKN